MGAGLGSAFQSPFPIWDRPRVPQLTALHLSSEGNRGRCPALCSAWPRTKSRQVLSVCTTARQVLLRVKSNTPKRDKLAAGRAWSRSWSCSHQDCARGL